MSMKTLRRCGLGQHTLPIRLSIRRYVVSDAKRIGIDLDLPCQRYEYVKELGQATMKSGSDFHSSAGIGIDIRSSRPRQPSAWRMRPRASAKDQDAPSCSSSKPDCTLHSASEVSNQLLPCCRRDRLIGFGTLA